MLGMAKAPKSPKSEPVSATSPSEPDGGKRKRNAIFITLDEATEERLKRFLDKQRIKPDRAAVAFTALIEFLDREEAGKPTT